MKTKIQAKLGKLAPALFLPALLPGSPFMNTDFVLETPEVFVAQPDLDGDGIADIVVIDRASGILRPGLFSGTGALAWLEPVPGGVGNVTGVAGGPFENAGYDSLALVAEAANRIHVFALSGSTLNRSPRTVYNSVFGLGELAAVEEAGSGTPATVELVGVSAVADPSIPGIRDCLTWSGSGMASYAHPFLKTYNTERDYRNVLAETGVAMLGCLREEVLPGSDGFMLVDTASGGFPVVAQVAVPPGSELVQASLAQSGDFQFVFHVPGSSGFDCWSWNGTGLSHAGTFSLPAPAQRLTAYATSAMAGLFATSADGLDVVFYAFDGWHSPVVVDSLSPASGYPVSAIVPLPDEDLLVLSGPTGTDPAGHAERFARDGGFFVPVSVPPPPAIDLLIRGSNVLLYSEPPLINENPSLTGRFSSGVWTSAVSIGASVEATVETYRGEITGLGDPQPVVLGTTPAATTDALPNQVDPDVSLFDYTGILGDIPGSVVASPEGGSYTESVSVSFIPSDPAIQVRHRLLPDGGWASGTGPAGPFFRDFSLQYFATAADGRRTPIHTAAYQIPVDPSELDSDHDGVPDYVEIDAGIDPVHSGDDADGDGYSDLVELLTGSDPSDPLSLPPAREMDTDGDGFADLEEAIAGTSPTDPLEYPSSPGVLNFQNVFDLLAVPYSHDGVSRCDVPSLDESLEIPGGDPLATTVRLYDAASSLIGVDRTALHGLGGLTDPSAYFEEVGIAYPELFQVIATEENFPVDIVAADRVIGRQIVALAQFPEVSLPSVPYAYGSSGGSLAAEAAAWTAAAHASFLALDRPQLTRQFDLFDTLVLLLTELKVETVLAGRGILSGDPLTLTGFRPVEAAVPLSEAPGDGSAPVIVPAATLAFLRHKAGPSDSGYLLSHVFEIVEQTVQGDSTASVLDLRAVAGEIHRISAANGNASPGSLLPPLDALRQFVRTGSLLNTGYLSDPQTPPLDAGTLASAYSGVGYVLSMAMARPIEFHELVVTAGSFTGACTVLQDTLSGESVSLLDFNGNAYALPDAFQVPPGSVILVEGYGDVSSECPADRALEVIPPVSLVVLPVAATADIDEDLIPDAVEELYPIVLDTFGDSDGDGFSDLQETLDVTDPTDPLAHPAGAPVDLSPPTIAIHESGPASFALTFAFPEDYADRFAFRLFSGPDLDSIITDTGLDAPHTGGGVFILIIPRPPAEKVFFRFKMILD
jgi:hypothetical protein